LVDEEELWSKLTYHQFALVVRVDHRVKHICKGRRGNGRAKRRVQRKRTRRGCCCLPRLAKLRKLDAFVRREQHLGDHALQEEDAHPRVPSVFLIVALTSCRYLCFCFFFSLGFAFIVAVYLCFVLLQARLFFLDCVHWKANVPIFDLLCI